MLNGPFLDHKLNKLHNGTARMTIGHIPVSFEESDAPPFESINGLITEFIAPGLSMKYTTEATYKALVHIPIQEDTEYNDKILSVTMFADDRAENYWCLYRYMETLQSGQNGWPSPNINESPYGTDGHYRNRLMYIPNIDITMADGSMQVHQTVRFLRCFPVQLGDLRFVFTESTPSYIGFNVSFVYSNREIVRSSPPMEDTIPKSIDR